MFWEEAERYRVTPLLATLSTFFGILPPIAEKTTFEFRGDVQDVLSGMIPRIYNRSYSITADLASRGAEPRASTLRSPTTSADSRRTRRTASSPQVFDDRRLRSSRSRRSTPDR